MRLLEQSLQPARGKLLLGSLHHAALAPGYLTGGRLSTSIRGQSPIANTARPAPEGKSEARWQGSSLPAPFSQVWSPGGC